MNPSSLSANPTKWPNTVKQLVGCCFSHFMNHMAKHAQAIRRLLSTNYLSMLDHIEGLALKGLLSKSIQSFEIESTHHYQLHSHH